MHIICFCLWLVVMAASIVFVLFLLFLFVFFVFCLLFCLQSIFWLCFRDLGLQGFGAFYVIASFFFFLHPSSCLLGCETAGVEPNILTHCNCSEDRFVVLPLRLTTSMARARHQSGHVHFMMTAFDKTSVLAFLL